MELSIIIPTYNGIKYIEQTILSCINQEGVVHEIIVIDDASSDSSFEFIKRLQTEIKFRLYKNEENLGIIGTVNKGISLSNGKYVAAVGHDDFLNKDHYVKMIRAMEKNKDCFLAYCNSYYINSEGDKIKNNKGEDKTMYPLNYKGKNKPYFHIALHNIISSCGLVYRKEIFGTIKCFGGEYRNYGEWETYVALLKVGSIVFVDSTFAYYRRHETNITNSFKDYSQMKELRKFYLECRLKGISNPKLTFSEKIVILGNMVVRDLIMRFKIFVK